MRKAVTALTACVIALASCGEDPSGPSVPEGPTSSELWLLFSGEWSPGEESGPKDLSWEVTATWSMCSDTAAFLSYTLFRSQSPGIEEEPGTADLLDELESPVDTQLVDSTGLWDTDYWYAVRTMDEDSLTAWSGEVWMPAVPRTSFGGPDYLREVVQLGAGAAGLCELPDQDMVYVACYHQDAVWVVGSPPYCPVEDTIAVGDRPLDVCADPSGEHLLVSNNGEGTVSLLDAPSGQVDAVLEVGGSPAGICFAGGLFLVACHGSDMLYAVDAGAAGVVDSVEVGDGPWDVCGVPEAGRAFVACRGGGTVSVVDTGDLSVTATIPAGQDPKAVCRLPGQPLVCATDGEGGSVFLIHTRTEEVVDEIAVSGGPAGCVGLPSGNLLYVCCYWSNRIEAYNAFSRQRVFALEDVARPLGACAVQQGEYLYFTSFGTGELFVYSYGY
jgi:YVTN family beta-propeller protein